MKNIFNPHILLTFDKMHSSLRLSRETASEPLKNCPYMMYFIYFDFEM